MTRLASMSFRRVLLPALLLLLPVAASAFATSAAPATDPTILPTRKPAPATDEDDDTEAQDKTMPPGKKTSASVSAGAVSVSLASAPFLSAMSGDQIVREFVVRNDGSTPADFTVVMRYIIGWHNEFTRSVTTSRKIPPRSIQKVSVFVPTSFNDASISVENPQIYINGKKLLQLPTGIFDAGGIEQSYHALPSSFAPYEYFIKVLLKEIPSSAFNVNSSYSLRDGCGFSNSDTVQWPAIPQFYQAKDILFRKTTDVFTPDAERAIRDAVMLGATEFLFIPRGEQRPEWAPAPAIPGRPVVMPRGFGRTIVLDERFLFDPTQENSASKQAEETSYPTRPRNENADMAAAERGNRQTLDYLASEHLFIQNPAVTFQMLPCIRIPNLSFAVVILALLAYIIVVGPVNYFYLIRKKKKNVLMLLLTVPLISLVFVGIVILFVTFFEGWFSRASAVGATFLDQQENMAYTRAAVNLYAPLPVRRLVFDNADTVSFVAAKNAHLSLGRDQVVTGANKARIPLVYGISRAEKHLEQLRISRPAANTLAVMNGLGAPVKILAMTTPDGERWFPPDGVIPPGVSVELKRFTGKNNPVGANMKRLNGSKEGTLYPGREQLLFAVSAYLFEEESPKNEGNTAYYRDRTAFKENMLSMKSSLETTPDKDSLSPFAAVLSPGMYIAETDRPLFYTPGCSPVSFRARHLIVGTFTLQESAHEN